MQQELLHKHFPSHLQYTKMEPPSPREMRMSPSRKVFNCHVWARSLHKANKDELWLSTPLKQCCANVSHLVHARSFLLPA